MGTAESPSPNFLSVVPVLEGVSDAKSSGFPSSPLS